MWSEGREDGERRREREGPEKITDFRWRWVRFGRRGVRREREVGVG